MTNIILAILFAGFIAASVWFIIRLRKADQKARIAKREEAAAEYAAIREQWKAANISPARATWAAPSSYHRAGVSADVPKPGTSVTRTKSGSVTPKPKSRPSSLADSDAYEAPTFGYVDYDFSSGRDSYSSGSSDSGYSSGSAYSSDSGSSSSSYSSYDSGSSSSSSYDSGSSSSSSSDY